MDIRDKICDIVAMVFRIEAQDVKNRSDDEPLGVLGLDSLNCMDIVVNLEEEFTIIFHDEELLLDSLNTVRKLQSIVGAKLALVSTGGI